MTIRRMLGVLAALAAAGAAALVPATAAHAAPPVPGSPYNIINFSSDKCLQPRTADAGALIEQRDCDGNLMQRWTTRNRGDGYVALQNVYTRMCIDLKVNSPDEVGNGTPIEQMYCNDAWDSQGYRAVNGSRLSHFQIFVKEQPTSCLDVTNRSSANGAPLQLYSCKFFETAQEFRFLFA
jgi:hypothetical protein